MKRFFSTTELAKICQVSRFTTSKWVREGRIRGASPGRNYKIPIGEIIRFLKESNFPIPEELKTGYRDYDRHQKYCWEYHAEQNDISLHQCSTCIIKEAEILNCFIMRIDDYQDNIKCPIECSKCSYFLEKFANHFAIVKAFDEPAIICSNEAILAANQGFSMITGLSNESSAVGQDLSHFLSDASRTHFLGYIDKVRTNDPSRPEYVKLSIGYAKGVQHDVYLSCKKLKNIPNTFLIFFKVL
jgi:excisionase family DNA binding protein